MKRIPTHVGRFALSSVAAAALCLAAPAAWSLGLGRLQVQSALGESLRAEIDVTSLTPDEAANLRVRIAQPDAYRAAGVEYNSVLPNADVSLQRRPDGRPYLRITSDRGVQEPFVDLILEMNWATGRLVREYTMLFDPPPTARAVPAPPAVSTSPQIAAAPVPPAAPRQPIPSPAERRARARPEPLEPAPERARPTSVAGAPADGYKVRPGDSLSRIASRTQPAGVSLDQMLVALYRSNPDAFIDSNMNLLKSGVVLTVPSADTAKGMSSTDARQVIQAQSADFGAYRQRLASGVPTARTEGSSRQASGKVDAAVTDRQQGTAPTPDRLTLSKGAASRPSGDEQRVSKDRERKSSDARVAELSKNVDELKRLSSAASQPAASAPPVAATPASVPPVVAAPAPVPPAVAPPPPVAAAPASTPPLAVVVPVPASAPIATAAASSPAATAAMAAASRPTPAPAAAPEEPGLIGSLMDDNPVALGVGAIAILGLAGFAAYRFGKRGKRDSGETSFLESRLQPDSFFGASGGQRIDTRDAGAQSSSMSYSLSQLDAIGDVDPVAEADVYLAYGRDLQAEEILKEAMRTNPDRMAIRTKLLEVYAKRRDTKGFELLATQLFTLTKGTGEDWARAQELGRQLDPENALYRPGGAPVLSQGEGGRVVEPLGASTMPQSVLPSPSQFNITQPPDSSRMDLDLDLGDPDPAPLTAPSPLEATQAFKPEPAAAARRSTDDDAMSLDFTLPDLGVPESTPPTPTQRAAAPMPFDLSDLSLDLDLPASTAPTAAETTTPRPQQPNSGFDRLDLALDPEPEPAGGDDPLVRKLELADEFRQIGDADGARDLLQEVIAKATGSVKTRAQGMLADLG